MFSKSKNNANGAGKTPVPPKPAVPSIISADLTINGDLESDGEIQIDGTVNGDIQTTALLVGETAHVRGEIRARRVRVHGRVDGQITATSVTLAKTAHVVGDVVHEDLAIEKGAFLEGHCKRMAETSAVTKPATADKSNAEQAPRQPIPANAARQTSAGTTAGAPAGKPVAAATGS